MVQVAVYGACTSKPLSTTVGPEGRINRVAAKRMVGRTAVQHTHSLFGMRSCFRITALGVEVERRYSLLSIET